MNIFQTLIFLPTVPAYSFRLARNTHTPPLGFKIHTFNDSLFRDPIPGEELRLPKVHQASGEYILDRPLIEKVATLRTFIESIEINRGKKDEHTAPDEDDSSPDRAEDSKDDEKITEINEETLEPIRDLLTEEDLLEEVLSTAFDTYRKKNDIEASERLLAITEEIVPVASKLRKEKSESNITRLIRCFMVLEELEKNKALDKYLLQRLDELINLAGKKYRLSDSHPAMSEEFLKILKDRIAAQRITTIRGTDIFVKTLAKCFQAEQKEWDTIVRVGRTLQTQENIRTIENLEGFHQWLLDGIDYCKTNKRMEDKVDTMENLVHFVVKQHPIWNPKEDYIEHERMEGEKTNSG